MGELQNQVSELQNGVSKLQNQVGELQFAPTTEPKNN